jgi:hypothetical protein
MDIILVTPDTLRLHWPRIRASLDVVQSKSPEDWIAEDVFHAIKSGSAACHIAIDAKGYAGLMVTTKSVAEFSGEQSLHVWIAHNEGDNDVMAEGLDILRRMAQHGGFKRITFGSKRPGWAKRYKLVSATYEVEA